MAYGTLAVKRSTFRGVEVTPKGGDSFALPESQARAFFDREFATAARREHESAAASVKIGRARFLESVTLRKNVESKDASKRNSRPEQLVDQVVMGDDVIEMYPGRSSRFVEAEADRRFPEPDPLQLPDFTNWWAINSAELTAWTAIFVTAGQSEPVTIRMPDRADVEFPIQPVLSELDRRQANGWSLVHVSEDRGVKGGHDSGSEAYVTRARYLMLRDDPRAG